LIKKRQPIAQQPPTCTGPHSRPVTTRTVGTGNSEGQRIRIHLLPSTCLNVFFIFSVIALVSSISYMHMTGRGIQEARTEIGKGGGGGTRRTRVSQSNDWFNVFVINMHDLRLRARACNSFTKLSAISFIATEEDGVRLHILPFLFSVHG